jgi:hypothetical protein
MLNQDTKNNESLNRAMNHFLNLGNFDHNFDSPSFQDEISKVSKTYGLSLEDSGKAYFAARDVSSLIEGEKLDGGDGSTAKNLEAKDVMESTFSKGEDLDNRFPIN